MALKGVEIRGDKAVLRRLRALGDRGVLAVAGGLFEAAQEIIGDAKERTPVLTGNLRASGHVQPVTLRDAVRGQTVRFVAGFGGPAGAGNQGESNSQAVGYAVYVHERGPRPGGVGESKFLEKAVRAKESQIATRVSERVALLIRDVAR